MDVRIDEACALLNAIGTMAMWYSDNDLAAPGEQINLLAGLAQDRLKGARHG